MNTHLKTSFWFILFFVAGLFTLVFPFVGFDFSRNPGSWGDMQFNLYVLEHGYKFVCGEVNSFWNAPFFYPVQNTIAISDNLIANWIFYIPARLLGASPERAFQFWFLSCIFLNFTSCFYVCKKWGFEPFYAGVISFLFAFSVLFVNQYLHAQVFLKFFIPLAFYHAWVFSKTFSLLNFRYLLVFWFLTLLSGLYLGFFMIIYLLVFVVLGTIFNNSLKALWLHLRDHYFGYLINILPVLLCTIALLWHYMFGTEVKEPWPYMHVVNSAPKFYSYFITPEGSTFRSFFANFDCFTYYKHIHALYFGYFLFLFLVFLSIRNYKYWSDLPSQNKFFMLMFWVTFAIFIAVGNASIYAVFYLLPGFSSMRDLCRHVNIQIFFIALMVFGTFQLIIDKYVKFDWLKLLLFFAITFLIIYDNVVKYKNFTSISIAESINRTDSLARLVKPYIKQGENNVLLLSIQKSKQNGISHLDAMLVSQKLNIACVNGYSAIEPKDYGTLKDTVSIQALEPWKTKFSEGFKNVNLIYIK